MSATSDFWTDPDYEDLRQLAIEYERNIETTHPGSVTSDRMCVCLDLGCAYCGWAASKVQYREYRGPDVTNIDR